MPVICAIPVYMWLLHAWTCQSSDQQLRRNKDLAVKSHLSSSSLEIWQQQKARRKNQHSKYSRSTLKRHKHSCCFENTSTQLLLRAQELQNW
eukprot:5984739-Pleurochrysis_carterae.AAC.1